MADALSWQKKLIDLLRNGDLAALKAIDEQDRNLFDSHDRYLGRHWAITASREASLPVLNWLLATKRYDLRFREEGMTVLHAAMERATGDILEVASLLVQWGADVDGKGMCGWTALHVAAGRGDIELVSGLLRLGANGLCETDDGLTAEDIAENWAHPAVAEYLRRTRQSNP